MYTHAFTDRLHYEYQHKYRAFQERSSALFNRDQ
jgi:hypothetical protein